MSDKLFLNTLACTGDGMVLGFAVGTPVVFTDGEKLRELPDGLTEYAMTVSGGDDRFEVRVVADSAGAVQKVIASAGPAADDWHEESNGLAEEREP